MARSENVRTSTPHPVLTEHHFYSRVTTNCWGQRHHKPPPFVLVSHIIALCKVISLFQFLALEPSTFSAITVQITDFRLFI